MVAGSGARNARLDKGALHRDQLRELLGGQVEGVLERTKTENDDVSVLAKKAEDPVDGVGVSLRGSKVGNVGGRSKRAQARRAGQATSSGRGQGVPCALCGVAEGERGSRAEADHSQSSQGVCLACEGATKSTAPAHLKGATTRNGKSSGRPPVTSSNPQVRLLLFQSGENGAP